MSMLGFVKEKKEEHIVDQIKKLDQRGNHNKVGERIVQLKERFNKNIQEIRKAIEKGIKNNDFNDARQRLAKEIQSLQYWNSLSFRAEYKPIINAALEIRSLLVNYNQGLAGKVNTEHLLENFDKQFDNAKQIIAQAANKVVDNIVDEKLKEMPETKAA